ncbi:hypothetical protein [Micromonospora rubida]|uniref:hypothetical protein n=1 Tax=Micromonospora rubida TaxID=2697657 RepID=UPI0013767A16|nr:hypothetical protein [Micromonospora rubida]NBE85418.1 hypothetical protein [Micromonospora rubida]
MGDDGVIEPTGQVGLPSGIVISKDNFSARTKGLLVYDVATGNLLATAVAPGEASVNRREAFDARMHRLAYTNDCELYVATLTGGTYVPSGRWKPPQAFGEAKQCFDTPTFGEDGRIRATVGAAVSEPGRVVSVDPAQPDTAPMDEGAGSVRQEKKFRIAGLNKSDVRVYVGGDTVTDLVVTGVKPGGDVLSGDFWYDCKTQVDKAAFLCTSSRDISRQYYGSVALATVDVPAGTVTVKQVAPASKASRPTVLPAPDRKQVAINDSTGWYTTSLEGASSPARQPLSDQQNLGDILFWA